jgi:hypothetical protein
MAAAFTAVACTVNGCPALCTLPPLAPVLASGRVVPAVCQLRSVTVTVAKLDGRIAKRSFEQPIWV